MEETLTNTTTRHTLGKPHQVVLFNDDHHDMMEVALQIVRATSCSPDHAWKIMLEAHSSGRAVVIVAHKERCEHVSAVLEEIRLGTKVEPV